MSTTKMKMTTRKTTNRQMIAAMVPVRRSEGSQSYMDPSLNTRARWSNRLWKFFWGKNYVFYNISLDMFLFVKQVRTRGMIKHVEFLDKLVDQEDFAQELHTRDFWEKTGFLEKFSSHIVGRLSPGLLYQIWVGNKEILKSLTLTIHFPPEPICTTRIQLCRANEGGEIFINQKLCDPV